jgi:hypothetical protein
MESAGMLTRHRAAFLFLTFAAVILAACTSCASAPIGPAVPAVTTAVGGLAAAAIAFINGMGLDPARAQHLTDLVTAAGDGVASLYAVFAGLHDALNQQAHQVQQLAQTQQQGAAANLLLSHPEVPVGVAGAAYATYRAVMTRRGPPADQVERARRTLSLHAARSAPAVPPAG